MCKHKNTSNHILIDFYYNQINDEEKKKKEGKKLVCIYKAGILNVNKIYYDKLNICKCFK